MDQTLAFQYAYATRLHDIYGGNADSAWRTAGDLIAAEPLTPERAKQLFVEAGYGEAQTLHSLYENNVYNTLPQSN